MGRVIRALCKIVSSVMWAAWAGGGGVHGRRGLNDAGGPYSICLGTPISLLGDNLISAKVPHGSPSSALSLWTHSRPRRADSSHMHGAIRRWDDSDAGPRTLNGAEPKILRVVSLYISLYMMLYRLVVSTISTSETPIHYHLQSNISSWCVNDDDIAGAAAAAVAIATAVGTAASPTSVTMDKKSNDFFDGEMIMIGVSTCVSCIVDLCTSWPWM